MKNTKINILFGFICLLGFTQLKAQGLKVTSLKSNAIIKQYLADNPQNVWSDNATLIGITDTLDLPFFEDFTGSIVFPDFTKFIDNAVYVNNTFPISPPSYGVATFDNLNRQGNPYSILNEDNSSISDYLTSQPINLKNYLLGATLTNYTLADSIFFSFQYQKGGNGDAPEAIDSLVLQFKDSSQNWNTVWSTAGGGISSFKSVIVGLDSNHYLFEDFQFRFYNYSKNTGNLNHWHVDFIQMSQDRNSSDTAISEVAIIDVSSSLLKRYGKMPYDQFLANYANEIAPNFELTYRNSAQNIVNTALQFEAFNQYNTAIKSSPFSANNRNINPRENNTEPFTMFDLDTFSGKEPSVTIKYSIQPQSNDNTASEYKATTDNNVMERTYYFPNYFSYDDGSPEAGMGLEYGGLPSGEGYVASKFTANKEDSIWGVNIHLTQILKDVSSIPFEIVLWKKLTSSSETHMRDDEIIYSQSVTYLKPDTINGNYYIAFDTAQFLEPGDFYIGWKQNSKYYFNVGYDKNYKFENTDQVNPNLFYNILGYWRPANLKGAIMMHPVVGDFERLRVGMDEIETQEAVVYPNPAKEFITVVLPSSKVSKVEIYSAMGRKVLEANSGEIQIGHLTQGSYFLKIWSDLENKMYTKTFIKTH